MQTLLGLVLAVLVCSCVAVAPAFAQSGGSQQPSPAQGDKPAAADPISGEWEGVVDLSDGPVAFTMTLKLDGDKVTGEIASSAGTTTISEGAWVDGQLTLAFVYIDGAQIVMGGSVGEEQLTGSLSYGDGQMVANWAARKKPTR